MEYQFAFWLILFVILSFIELITTNLVTIWFAVGALCAFLFSIFDNNLSIQIIIFVLSSMISMILSKPIIKKYLNFRREKTNFEALIGKKCLVTSEINNFKDLGEVKINGILWSARSFDDSIIDKDKFVIINEVSGSKLIVKNID